MSQDPRSTEQNEDLSFTLGDDDIRTIARAVHAQDSDTVHAALKDLSPADTAEFISKITDEDRSELIAMYGDILPSVIFNEMNPELSRACLSAMPAHQVADIITELESNDALELIETLDDKQQEEVTCRLSIKTQTALEEGLSYPEDSAGRLMQREIVAVPHYWNAGKAVDYLRSASDDLPDEFFDIFVINPSYHVQGQIPLNQLLRNERSVKLEDLIKEETYPVPATMDQEEVAHLFRRENIISAPVIDESERLIGVITIDDIVDVIDEEAQEDILRMAGVEQNDLYSAILSTTGTRFRWLFINLFTAILASVVISFFGATLQELVALAILMPIVASMGGNAGTQALAVAVRALSTKELSGANTSRIIWKETAVGTLNGAAFALITGVIAALWFENATLGLVIAMAMVINLVIAGFFGAVIPILLDRSGSDPAIASTVLLTTITDIIGFISFLGLATLLL